MTTWLVFLVTVLAVGEDLYEGLRPHSINSLHDPIGIIGVLIVLIGLGIRSWSAGILRKSEALATTGPYALMRHPLYFGSLLIAVGFCILLGDLENYFLVLGVFFIFHLRKAFREERKLRLKFGDAWDIYTQRVGFFYPRMLPATLYDDWSLARWWRNTEYGAFASGLIGLAFVETWHAVLFRYPLSCLLKGSP
jgi:protein-S-isoprenylcysteine O-methyltransferase Ste14